jgi:hypothetical protein
MRAVVVAALLLTATGCGAGNGYSAGVRTLEGGDGASTAPTWPVVTSFTFDASRQSAPPVFLKAGQAWLGGECTGHVQKAAAALFAMGNHVVSTPPILDIRVTPRPSGQYVEVDLDESYLLTGSLLGDASCTVEVRQR